MTGCRAQDRCPPSRWRRSLGSALAFTGLARPAVVSAATPIPRHVFSPYFETWNGDSLTAIAHQSGARYFTMAFLETLGRNSCVLAWGGDSSRRVGSGAYVSDIASLRALGGDVTTASFGGWSADQHGTEIGDSCKDANKIAAAYEDVITTYDVSRLDMDIEGRSLGRTNGIDRRNKAIKLVQDWASANNRPLTISYTVPTSRDGLESDAMAVLHNAVAKVGSTSSSPWSSTTTTARHSTWATRRSPRSEGCTASSRRCCQPRHRRRSGRWKARR